MTAWPTIREASRALGLRQGEIYDDTSGLYQLTGYNGADDRFGDLTVEADTPDVEAAWCEYWLPFSAGCHCGRHRSTQERRP